MSYVNWNSLESEDKNYYFLKFFGKCKSKKCNNIFHGFTKEGPTTEGYMMLNIKTNDTRNDPEHEVVKKDLNGLERTQVGEKLIETEVGKYMECVINKKVIFGQVIPPFFRDDQIYRQTKMEVRKIQSDLKLNDVLKSIVNFAHKNDVREVMRSLDIIKFSVIYFTVDQIDVYKEYIRVMKDMAFISTNSTGRVVKKFELRPGKKTEHIFSYTIKLY